MRSHLEQELERLGTEGMLWFQNSRRNSGNDLSCRNILYYDRPHSYHRASTYHYVVANTCSETNEGICPEHCSPAYCGARRYHRERTDAHVMLNERTCIHYNMRTN